MIDLTGRTVLLTGASGGIGSATARALGEAGANLVAHYGQNRRGVEEATEGLPADRLLLLAADLSDPAALHRLWESAVGWRGSIDVVVSNAAVMPEAGIDEPPDLWDNAWTQALALNVRATADLIKLATLHFIDHGGGVLITMSSWAAQQGSGNHRLGPYAASKAAAAAFTKTLARAYAGDGVLAYCIAPGAVDTEMTARAVRDQDGLEAVLSSLRMNELIPPSEVADLVAFLATGTHRHLSGATIDVNGATYIR